MANSRSARKRIRANERKHVRNRTVRSAVRTRITKARRALLGTEVGATPELVLAAVRELDRAAEKGILHHNNVNRRKSRLMAMAHRLGAVAEGGAAGEDQAAARAAAAGGEKGRSSRGTKAAAGKSAAKSSAKPAAKTTARAAADKPKTSTTRAKKA